MLLSLYLAVLDDQSNEEQFIDVYNTYKRLVYHTAYKIMGDSYLAEDVLQEVFLLSMSKKRFLSIVLSAVMILSLACSALAVGQSGRYIGNSTVNGSIYQTYYQVDAQTRTGIKSISVSGTLYEKGTFGTWQRVSNCSNTSTTSNCMASSNYNTKPGKSYKLEYSATFNYSDGRSETITSTTTH